MLTLSPSLVFCLVSVALFGGCAQSAVNAARPPSRPDIETRVTPQTQKQPLELPRLIAPPPAYGNKIVMAQLALGHRD